MVSVVAAKTVPLEDRLRLRQRRQGHIGFRDRGGHHNRNGMKHWRITIRLDVVTFNGINTIITGP